MGKAPFFKGRRGIFIGPEKYPKEGILNSGLKEVGRNGGFKTCHPSELDFKSWMIIGVKGGLFTERS